MVLALVAAFIFLGGVTRIASVTEKLVPIMALFYLAGGLVLLAAHITELPHAFQLIFQGAFDPQAVMGGAAGIGVREAMRFGVARGLFSNEAGMGSTPHAHAMAKVAKPQDQGIVAMICVFIDTFIVLTMTALVMITSGALNVDNMAENPAAENMAQVAFTTVFQGFGNLYVAICLLFFAFSTVIGWYFFGAQNVKYLFGVKAVKVYACIAVVCVALGSMLEAPLVWNLSDLFNALMVFPNLIALIALSGQVAKLAREDDHQAGPGGRPRPAAVIPRHFLNIKTAPPAQPAGPFRLSKNLCRTESVSVWAGGARGGGSPPRMGSNALDALLCKASGEQSEDFCAAARRKSNGIFTPGAGRGRRCCPSRIWRTASHSPPPG